MRWADQYKHPNWQRKRLEALEHAAFCCEMCGDGESQLHVHHKRYVKGRMMWEYSLGELSVLCESCHEYAHQRKDQMQALIARIHPEGEGDLLAVMAGFVHHARGPARADAEDVAVFSDNPFCVAAGALAALANYKLDMHTISAICRFLDEAEGGESITFTVPLKRAFGDGRGL